MSNRFCFVSPMYNAGETLHRMFYSIASQSYENWRIVLIDDVSSPTHMKKEASFLWNVMYDERFRGKVDVIWNTKKRWEVENVLLGIRMCNEDDIVCRIDADDWLVDADALHILNIAYENGHDAVWTAHRWGFSDRNISAPMLKGADPYVHPWVSSHLKTFRRSLLSGVPDVNFRNQAGEYVRRAGDQAIYLPVLKRASKPTYIPRVMYHYSIDDADGKVYQTEDARMQRDEALFLRQRNYVFDGDDWEIVLK